MPSARPSMRRSGPVARKSDIDWPTIFAWVDTNSAGPVDTAKQFDLAEGTVLAAFHRRRSEKKVETAELKAAAVYVPLGQLLPWEGNPRKNEKAVNPLADSIIRFGWGAVLLVRKENGVIIGGHTRLKAAYEVRSRWTKMSAPQRKAATMYWSSDALAIAQDEVPQVPVRYMALDEGQAHGLALADNKIGELSTWNEEMLTAQFRETPVLDLQGLGWSDKDVKRLLNPPPTPDAPTAPTVKVALCPHCNGELRR